MGVRRGYGDEEWGKPDVELVKFPKSLPESVDEEK